MSFQGKNGGVPHPRTESEWIEKKMSQGHSYDSAFAEARQNVRNDVFGVGHQTDAKGNPIEQGIGSANNQTVQSKQALEHAAQHRAAARSKIGYTPYLKDAFDPKLGV